MLLLRNGKKKEKKMLWTTLTMWIGNVRIHHSDMKITAWNSTILKTQTFSIVTPCCLFSDRFYYKKKSY